MNEKDEAAKAAKVAKAEAKAKAAADNRQEKADDELAVTPSPAAERAALGDWAKGNSPSPAEQQAESERQGAIDRIADR